MDDLELCLYDLESFQTILKVSGRSKKCPDHPENVAGLSKILQNHLLCAFVADLKNDAIYALYPESFCDKKLAIRKVFAFCDSACGSQALRCAVRRVDPLQVFATFPSIRAGRSNSGAN